VPTQPPPRKWQLILRYNALFCTNKQFIIRVECEY
jgi:hypothetical protein